MRYLPYSTTAFWRLAQTLAWSALLWLDNYSCLNADEQIANISRSIAHHQPEYLRSYVARFCLECHNASKREGDFDLTALRDRAGIEDAQSWGEIRERLASREMPPSNATQPTAEETQRIIDWISAELTSGEALRLAKRERVSYRRLTREEYVNTIYDLLAVHYDATDPGGLTEDPEWHGFERLGEVLSLSKSHIDRYLQAADTILAEAYPDETVPAKSYFRDAVVEKNIAEPYRSQLVEQGRLDQVRYEMWPQDKYRYPASVDLTSPGVYEATVRLSGLKPVDAPAPRLLVYAEKLDRVLFERDVIADEFHPIELTFRAHLPAGRHSIVLINDVPGPSNLPRYGRHGNKPFVTVKDGRLPWQIKLTDEAGEPLYPFLIIDSFEWKGPIVADEEESLRRTWMGLRDENSGSYKAGFQAFVQRAYRRPVSEEEFEPYYELIEREQASGSSLRSAVRVAMQAVLCSKDFLFLVEGSPEESRVRLNDWEFACRLSYLLWNTMPDESLQESAEAGTVQQPETLNQQIDRMLEDHRSQRFTESFASQWLRLRKVGMFPPDVKLFPDYDQHLEKSMIAETKRFIEEVFRQNLSLRELIDSDWSFINDRLARHYGLRGEFTDRLERVVLKPKDHRGGILTQAAILSLTSDGTRHRPVHRGVWFSETLLGLSPAPPPVNVEPIEPTPSDSPKQTVRAKLEAHQSNPNCSACHARIDPYGFAFENYDAVGRWRTVEQSSDGSGDPPIVSSHGVLTDGRKFANTDQFKAVVMEDIDRIGRNFIEKLASYAIRRTLTIDDQTAIDELCSIAKRNDYRVQEILRSLIVSDLFASR